MEGIGVLPLRPVRAGMNFMQPETLLLVRGASRPCKRRDDSPQYFHPVARTRNPGSRGSLMKNDVLQTNKFGPSTSSRHTEHAGGRINR